VTGLAPARPRAAGEDVIPAGPTVRRIAREIGLDLRTVIGTGSRGRIRLEDLDPFIKGFVAQRGGDSGTPVYGPPPIELPDFSKFGPIRRVKADSLRRKIAERMHQSWSTVPHVHQFFEADITELVELQKRLKERVKSQGGSLTVTVLMIKALAVVLKEFPQFNATWDAANGEIIYKDYFNIGVAVDTDAGLIVPVLRDVDKKTILQLSKELPELAQRTRERKTSMDDLRGGTFTVSNLGGIGGSHFTPIVNAPEVAILGIGRNQRRPVFDSRGNVVGRDLAPLVLGYDHRLIDGAQGARFVVRYTEILENFEAVILGF
jgi:pyruvate dehydrogenase E2 component (dihydrolipoamide acetyltransferase)